MAQTPTPSTTVNDTGTPPLVYVSGGHLGVGVVVVLYDPLKEERKSRALFTDVLACGEQATAVLQPYSKEP